MICHTNNGKVNVSNVLDINCFNVFFTKADAYVLFRYKVAIHVFFLNA